MHDEVDEPDETESKRFSAIMDQNTSSIKSNKVMIIHIFRNMKSRDIALWKDQFIYSCISGHEKWTIKVEVKHGTFELSFSFNDWIGKRPSMTAKLLLVPIFSYIGTYSSFAVW